MTAQDARTLQEMKTRIDGIERLVAELKDLGRQVPAVEKNCRCISSAIYILKFGISDVAEIHEADGGPR